MIFIFLCESENAYFSFNRRDRNPYPKKQKKKNMSFFKNLFHPSYKLTSSDSSFSSSAAASAGASEVAAAAPPAATAAPPAGTEDIFS
jgi:hypothetical protein